MTHVINATNRRMNMPQNKIENKFLFYIQRILHSVERVDNVLSKKEHRPAIPRPSTCKDISSKRGQLSQGNYIRRPALQQMYLTDVHMYVSVCRKLYTPISKSIWLWQTCSGVLFEFHNKWNSLWVWYRTVSILFLACRLQATVWTFQFVVTSTSGRLTHSVNTVSATKYPHSIGTLYHSSKAYIPADRKPSE